jgi:hypothetical protein
MAGSALALFIGDNTDVQRWNGSGPYQGGDWVDVIGADVDFDVYGIDVSLSDGNITFGMQTNFDSDGIYYLGSVTAYVADLFISTSSGNYGIVLLDHDLWKSEPVGSLDPGLYSVSTAATSVDLWSSKSGYIYGGQYDQTNAQFSRVAITSGTSIGSATVNGPSAFAGSANYLWEVIISANDIGLENGGVLDVFWAGASCSNDAVAGSVNLSNPGTSVPDAGIVWLLGSAFVAMGILGRKKFK